MKDQLYIGIVPVAGSTTRYEMIPVRFVDVFGSATSVRVEVK